MTKVAQVTVCRGHRRHTASGFVYLFFISQPLRFVSCTTGGGQVTWVAVMCWIKLSLLARFSKLIKRWRHTKSATVEKFPFRSGRWDPSGEAIMFLLSCIGDGRLDRLLSLLHQLHFSHAGSVRRQRLLCRGLCEQQLPSWFINSVSEFQVKLLVRTCDQNTSNQLCLQLLHDFIISYKVFTCVYCLAFSLRSCVWKRAWMKCWRE